MKSKIKLFALAVLFGGVVQYGCTGSSRQDDTMDPVIQSIHLGMSLNEVASVLGTGTSIGHGFRIMRYERSGRRAVEIVFLDDRVAGVDLIDENGVRTKWLRVANEERGKNPSGPK